MPNNGSGKAICRDIENKEDGPKMESKARLDIGTKDDEGIVERCLSQQNHQEEYIVYNSDFVKFAKGIGGTEESAYRNDAQGEEKAVGNKRMSDEERKEIQIRDKEEWRIKENQKIKPSIC